jgi:hypothetical protein
MEFFCILLQCKQSLLSLPCTSKKNVSFHFKRYNLTIRAVNFFETFCACSLSSLGQDPWARNGRFEHFFEKNDLPPSKIKRFHHPNVCKALKMQKYTCNSKNCQTYVIVRLIAYFLYKYLLIDFKVY